MMIRTHLAESNPHKEKFTVPHAPKSRSLKKLSQLLNHAKSIPRSNSIQSSQQPAHADTHKLSSMLSDDKVKARQTTPKLRRSPRHHAKSATPTPQQVTVAIARGYVFFNIRDEVARKRQECKQEWAFTIACGAMVEPPPSDVLEILVTPDTLASSIPLPKSYQDAVTGPYRRYWIEAIRVELENLLSRKVWREEPLPHGAKPVPGKYV